MTQNMSRFAIGTALGLMVFLRGIVGTYEMFYLGKTLPVSIVLPLRGAIDLGFLALMYVILSMTRGARLTMPSKNRTWAAKLLMAIVLWASFPLISVVPKTIASLFPNFVTYTSGGICGLVLVIGTLIVSGVIWTRLIMSLYSRSISDS